MLKTPSPKTAFPWELAVQGVILIVAVVREIIEHLEKKKKAKGDVTP